MSAAAEPSRKRARTQVASGDALDDDFTISEDFAAPTPLANPNAKAASTCNKGGGKAAALGHTRPLSKRQARKGRAVARAVGLPLGAGAGAGVIAIEGGVTLASASASASAAPAPLKYSKFDAAASTIIPWAPAADLALSLWALFRSSNVGSALSELEFVEPLTSSGVFPYPERLRGAVSGIVRAVLSRAAREAAGESRAQNGAAAPALIIITHSAPRASGLLRELSVSRLELVRYSHLMLLPAFALALPFLFASVRHTASAVSSLMAHCHLTNAMSCSSMQLLIRRDSVFSLKGPLGRIGGVFMLTCYMLELERGRRN